MRLFESRKTFLLVDPDKFAAEGCLIQIGLRATNDSRSAKTAAAGTSTVL